MKKLLGVLSGLALLALGSLTYLHDARGVNLPLVSGSPCTEPGQQQACINQLIQSINNSALGQVPAWSSPRNFLDNGAMQVQQLGTGIQTGQINAAAVVALNYAADRWFTSANVAVGAPRGQVITATPSPPVGFTASMKVYRNSGALTQPVCAIQVIPSYKAQQLQGQQVVLSAYIQALAGLATDQGAAAQVVNMGIITGTGTDEGLGSWTASPAITPAWTGVATLQTVAQALPSTPVWARYQNASIAVPTTVKEMAVFLCFTPTATGAGTTDGFAFTGVMLEQGTTASTYEFRAPGAELAEAQKYYYEIDEATGISGRAMCAVSTTSATKCHVKFPTSMYAVPVAVYTAGFASCTTTACTAVTACTSLATDAVATALNKDGVLVVCGSAAGFAAAGSAGWLSDNSGAGKMTFWAGI